MRSCHPRSPAIVLVVTVALLFRLLSTCNAGAEAALQLRRVAMAPPPSTNTTRAAPAAVVAGTTARSGHGDGGITAAVAARGLRSRRYFQEKTVFSDTSRAIFAAGLEGSGHHLIRVLADGCTGVDEGRKGNKKKKKGKTNNNRNPKGRSMAATGDPSVFHDRCVLDKTAMCLLYNNTPKNPNPHDSLFNSRESPDVFGTQRARYTHALHDLMGRAQLSFLNVDLRKTPPQDCVAGMMSYPNFGGPLKPIQHPNLHLLAEIAETAEVDLRVVLLLRDPLELLASAVLKRRFVESVSFGMEVALRNFEVLLQQLLLLDPAYFHCLDFNSLPGFESAFEGREWAGDEKRLGKFVVPPAMRDRYDFEQALVDLYREPSPSNATAEMQAYIDSSNALRGQFRYFTKLHAAAKTLCST